MNLFSTLTPLLPFGLVGWCLAAAGAAPTPSVNPYNEELALIFADEFDGTRLDLAVWESQSYDKGLSRDTARGPDNLEVRDGELRLHVRKEERPSGQRRSKWTAGFVHTRNPVENNVLIEVRFKPGQATGVNNAFWMTSEGVRRDGVSDRYEIDIVETRQDARASGAVGRGHVAWHDWKTQAYAKNAKGESDHIAQGIQVEHPFDQYQTWAIWYGEHEMIYFLEGREIWRGQTHARYHDQYRTGVGKLPQWHPNLEKEAYGKFGQDDWSYLGGYTGDRMNIVFSNLPWPETWTPLSDAAHGTYMAVDYVRVFRPARLVTVEPTQRLLTGEPVKLAPGSEVRVALPEAMPLATRGEFPSYFSFRATLTAGAELAAAFGAGEAQIFNVGGSVRAGLRAGFAHEVRTTTAFPANRRREPWLMAGQDMIWIGRYTPPLTAGGRATVSLCVFEAGLVPEREPFFHRNIDALGNTSVNNGWHLNAKEVTLTDEVTWVTFANPGNAPLTIRELKFGTSFRSLSSSTP
ncbi:MAG: family 16 glycosylhydrolase [Opitutaceae bacterium]